MKPTLVLAALVAGVALAPAAQAAAPIKPGTYHCIAGSSRMMLTLGDMTISGMSYSFKAPTGPVTRGTYSLSGTGYHFNGDIGAIANATIVEAGPDATPGDFYFKFKARPTSLPTSVACMH